MITGASRGLGKEFAIQLAAKKYALILVARNEERLNALREDLMQRFNVSVTVVVADLTVTADVDRIIAALASQAVDLIVNAAGFGTIGLFAHNCIEKSMRMVRLQVDAITRICYACLPGMLERNYGDIINIASKTYYGTRKYDNANLNSENCAYFDYLERYGIDYPKINLFAFPKNNKIVLYPDGSIRKVVSGKIERLSVDKSGEEENIGIALFYPEPGDKIGIGHNIFCLRLRTNGEIELSYKNKSITTSTDYEGLCPSKQTSP